MDGPDPADAAPAGSAVRTHPTARAATVDDLRGLALLDGLGADVLASIAERARVVELAQDERLVEAGEPADEMFILLEGGLEFVFIVSGQIVATRRFAPGSVSGLLPFSRMERYQGPAAATEPSRVAYLGREDLPDLVRTSPELGARLVTILADRVRDGTRNLEQRERMAALGKLSAGLAHELNNPGAAVRRGAAALRARLDTLPELVAGLVAVGLTHEWICAIDGLRAAALERPSPRLDPIERSEREDALEEWLGEHGVPDAWRLAETFVDAGVGTAELADAIAPIPAAAAPGVLAWIEAGIAADRLLAEIDTASARIADLVASVKAYSRMDRPSGRQPLDPREGIDSTLTMFGRVLDDRDIRVVRRYADGLPRVVGWPGELIQVWTNLIDNAIDAMTPGGVLTIDVGRRGRWVEVAVSDTGHGIPADLIDRIFEPFVTTREVGGGTGLGLDIARRIVVDHHGGQLDVVSETGRTTFTVRLPVAEAG